MKAILEQERDSAQRGIAAVKYAIYELALEEISEGVRTERLRALVKELHQLQAALKVNSTQPATREHHG